MVSVYIVKKGQDINRNKKIYGYIKTMGNFSTLKLCFTPIGHCVKDKKAIVARKVREFVEDLETMGYGITDVRHKTHHNAWKVAECSLQQDGTVINNAINKVQRDFDGVSPDL